MTKMFSLEGVALIYSYPDKINVTSLTRQIPHRYEAGFKQLLHSWGALVVSHVGCIQMTALSLSTIQSMSWTYQKKSASGQVRTHADKHATLLRCREHETSLLSEFTLPLCFLFVSVLGDIFLCPSFKSSSAALKRRTRDKERRMWTRGWRETEVKYPLKKSCNRMNMKVDTKERWRVDMVKNRWFVRRPARVIPNSPFVCLVVLMWTHTCTHSMWTCIQQVHVHRTGMCAHTKHKLLIHFPLLEEKKKKKD